MRGAGLVLGLGIEMAFVAKRAERGAHWTGSRGRLRGGQALAEFAVVSLVLCLLLATIIEFGRAWFVAQQIQSVADLAARELALRSLPAASSFTAALVEGSPSQDAPFDPFALVILESEVGDLDGDGRPLSTGDLELYFAALPIINRQLRPLMFFDEILGERALRYPGAVVAVGGELTVQVPVVTGYGGSGETQIEWHRVIEERLAAGASPFPIDATSTVPADRQGFVVLRVNYPYQATTLSAYRPGDGGQTPVAADGAILDPLGPLDGGVPIATDGSSESLAAQAYAGEYGLGRHYAMATTLRPFRQVLSFQAIYRREIWE